MPIIIKPILCIGLIVLLQTASANTPEPSTQPLPKHWSFEWVKEPIFGSKMFVIETGKNHSETILLVHGLGQNGFKDWLNVIPTLERDYHIITFDLPGFGRSESPNGRLSPENYAKVLNWLLKKKKKDKVRIIGHSMGGAISLQFGSDYPEKVTSAILIDVAGILERSAFAKHFTQTPLPLEFLPENLKKKTYKLLHFSDTLSNLVNKAPDPTPFLYKSDLLWALMTQANPNASAALALIETNFSQAIKNFNHPTTIVWGAQDRIAPIRTGKLLVKQLKNAELVVIPQADHVPMVSSADTLNRILLKALATPPSTQRINNPQRKIQDTLECTNLVDKSFSGNYRKVIIENCTKVTLRDVHAGSLIVKNSIVHLENSTFENTANPCVFLNSVVIATNIGCKGSTAIQATDSLLDFAGANIKAEEVAAILKGKSQLILSVSDIDSIRYKGDIHGAFNNKPTTGSTIIEDTLNHQFRR